MPHHRTIAIAEQITTASHTNEARQRHRDKQGKTENRKRDKETITHGDNHRRQREDPAETEQLDKSEIKDRETSRIQHM